MDNRKITIAITSYNRYEMTVESFAQVLQDSRVSEIVIVDDCSEDGSYEKLFKHFHNEPKVKVYQNTINLDCYRNKHRSVELASNEWVIVLDSDNIIGKDYLDAIYSHSGWRGDMVYQPSFAKPKFDFREFQAQLITKENVRYWLGKPMFDTCLNAMNYFVYRQAYLDVWDGSFDPHTADSIFQNYNWLKSGREIGIVSRLEYEHRVHAGSHYQNNNHKTGSFYDEVIEKLKQLR